MEWNQPPDSKGCRERVQGGGEKLDTTGFEPASASYFPKDLGMSLNLTKPVSVYEKWYQ